MTNPMYNLPPNYSGVTIQIANPAVNLGGGTNPNTYGIYNTVPPEIAVKSGQYGASPQACYCNTCGATSTNSAQIGTENSAKTIQPKENLPKAYPSGYYLNNYSNPAKNDNLSNKADELSQNNQNLPEQNQNIDSAPFDSDKYRYAAELNTNSDEQNFTKSQGIIENLDNRQAEIEEAKKNTKEKRVVALTDEYIKSLENYLNNPNDEIRLMASKEILTRLDEDKDRYNDAALNALLNKMLQDPSKLVRIASLSAFASQLASGNDFTVQLLHNIQANPNADKEDVLQAADILLKMSAGTEIKNVPNPQVKENKEQDKNLSPLTK